VYVPRFLRTGLPVLAGLAFLVAAFFFLRRRRRMSNATTGTPT